ncbi:MAG: phosphatase PAP2 family protein [Candidatus Colwellbacteria bacterium]|nr:phosphatase PAP2 family protein [Candidatus Colwellbacteria bacterium]
MSADKAIFDFIYGLSHRATALDWLFIFSAEYLIYFILLAVLFYLLFKVSGRKNQISLSLLGILSLIISRGILTEVIRFFYNVPRPFQESGVQALIRHEALGSFPSGHMAFLTPIVLLIFSLNRKLGIWLGISTLIVGFGRVAAGVHFPSDILGGIIVGVLGFYLAKLILRKKSLNSSNTTSKSLPTPF